MSLADKSNLNSFQVFPKKLSYLALVLSFSIILSQLFIIAHNISDFEKISNTEIPLLEMSATNLRLNGNIYFNIEKLLNSEIYKRKSQIKYIETFHNAISTNLAQLELVIHDLGIETELLKNRQILIDKELEVIQLVKDNKLVQAKKTFYEKEYQNRFKVFSKSSKEIAEKLTINRQRSIDSKRKSLVGMGIIIALSFILITIMWVRIYIGYNKNIQSRIELEVDLEEQRTLSFHSAKLASLGEMAAGIAHEINNPLTIITGSASRLKSILKKQNIDNPDINKHVTKINETIFRIASIVKSMRSISRDGSNDKLTEVSINDLFEDSLVLLSEKIKDAEVKLIVEVSPEAAFIYGRASELSQVMINLIGNSVDALLENPKENRTIKLIAINDDSRTLIKVIDNGPGIPAGISDKVFDPFYTTKDVGKGTGLGLSLSKKLIESNNGSIILDQRNKQVAFVLAFEKIEYIEKKSA